MGLAGGVKISFWDRMVIEANIMGGGAKPNRNLMNALPTPKRRRGLVIGDEILSGRTQDHQQQP